MRERLNLQICGDLKFQGEVLEEELGQVEDLQMEDNQVGRGGLGGAELDLDQVRQACDHCRLLIAEVSFFLLNVTKSKLPEGTIEIRV